MMPIAPIAQRSSAPPANILTMPIAPPCEWVLKKFRNAVLSKPGTVMNEISRTTTRIPTVNRMRDFSSGILKLLTKVLKILRNMVSPASSLRGHGGFAADDLNRAAFGFDFRFCRSAERAHAHRKFFGQFA